MHLSLDQDYRIQQMQNLFAVANGNPEGCIRHGLVRFGQMQLVDRMMLCQGICFELGGKRLELVHHRGDIEDLLLLLCGEGEAVHRDEGVEVVHLEKADHLPFFLLEADVQYEDYPCYLVDDASFYLYHHPILHDLYRVQIPFDPYVIDETDYENEIDYVYYLLCLKMDVDHPYPSRAGIDYDYKTLIGVFE